jgi:hypothetical protein
MELKIFQNELKIKNKKPFEKFLTKKCYLA